MVRPCPSRRADLCAIAIRPATMDDAEAICAIYSPHIAATTISFEEQPVTPDGERLLGYAYATRWRARPAYRTSVESTVYLDREACGRGAGGLLYRALLEKMGFRKAAHFSEAGRKFGRWVDVGYWELKLRD